MSAGRFDAANVRSWNLTVDSAVAGLGASLNPNVAAKGSVRVKIPGDGSVGSLFVHAESPAHLRAGDVSGVYNTTQAVAWNAVDTAHFLAIGVNSVFLQPSSVHWDINEVFGYGHTTITNYTASPSSLPVEKPTQPPSRQPTSRPSNMLSRHPPTSQPSAQPVVRPTGDGSTSAISFHYFYLCLPSLSHVVSCFPFILTLLCQRSMNYPIVLIHNFSPSHVSLPSTHK